MSVLVYTESEQGQFKKAAFEVASYAKAVATQLHTNVTAISINVADSSTLGHYGIDKVWTVQAPELETFNAKAYAEVIAQASEQAQAQVVILSSSGNSTYLAPRLAVRLDAGYASNVIALPTEVAPLTIRRNAFTNKAFETLTIHTKVAVISLIHNAFSPVENPVTTTSVPFSPKLSELDITIRDTERVSGKINIADADIVVSGGRGLKGPENWGLIEDLAQVLGAATACSKPVSDMGWRPHSEHVGQTGKPVAANLYVAVGISGAIQHLAGVNASKLKLVINNDPEAPFFKAADYGVVGDAFEVVPELIKKLKTFKEQR